MRNSIIINEPDTINNQDINASIHWHSESADLVKNKLVLEIIAAESCENFANYIEWLGLANDPKMIVLSSMHHYYYEKEDLKEVNTVINLKQLNQIKNINSLFESIFNIFPPNSNFIGCFAENNKHREFVANNRSTDGVSDHDSDALENGIISKFPFLNMIYNFMDSKTNRYMTRRNVYLLLEAHGYKILDMTEQDGLTYFLAQKVRVFPE